VYIDRDAGPIPAFLPLSHPVENQPQVLIHPLATPTKRVRHALDCPRVHRQRQGEFYARFWKAVDLTVEIEQKYRACQVCGGS